MVRPSRVVRITLWSFWGFAMSSSFKVSCQACGPQVVNALDMTVLLNRLPVGTTYVFTCPTCHTAHSAAANASLVSTLTSYGVIAVKGVYPEEGARRDSNLGHDEVAFIINEIHKIDLLAEAVERWVNSDGKNWTPRETDSAEGVGGDS